MQIHAQRLFSGIWTQPDPLRAARLWIIWGESRIKVNDAEHRNSHPDPAPVRCPRSTPRPPETRPRDASAKDIDQGEDAAQGETIHGQRRQNTRSVVTGFAAKPIYRLQYWIEVPPGLHRPRLCVSVPRVDNRGQ